MIEMSLTQHGAGNMAFSRNWSWLWLTDVIGVCHASHPRPTCSSCLDGFGTVSEHRDATAANVYVSPTDANGPPFALQLFLGSASRSGSRSDECCRLICCRTTLQLCLVLPSYGRGHDASKATFPGPGQETPPVKIPLVHFQ
jgi:hypothetical protein